MNRPAVFLKRAKPPTARPVHEVLARSDALAPLRGGIAQITALERDLAQFLPDYLKTGVEPGALKNGTLALFTPHNALAARLRHLEPALLQSLQQRGWAVQAFKIKVRPQPMAQPPAPKAARLSPVGAACLRALSEALAPSPLQVALTQMVERHRKPGGAADANGGST